MEFSLTPDLLFNTRQARQNATLRARLETVGQEVITGRRSDIYAATSGRVGDAFLLDQAAADLTRQQGAVNLARARLEAATISISSIREVTSGFTTDGRTALAIGQPNDLALLQERADTIISAVSGALNRRSGSRHLFAGTQSAGSPLAAIDTLKTAIDGLVTAGPDAAGTVAAIDDYFNAAGGGFETDIYQGSVEDGPRLHVSNSTSFDPIPKADDALFRSILQGFALVAASDQAGTDADRTALINEGLNIIDSTLDGMLAMESRLGASVQNLDRIEQGLTAEAALVASTQVSMLGRDTFDAAAELQALEGQLEASYTVTGRLGSLSLANFLR